MRAYLFAVLFAVAACGGKSSKTPTTPEPATETTETQPTEPPMAADEPAPAPTDAELEALMQGALAMFVAMGDAVDRTGGDCEQLAAALEQVMDDNAAFLAEAERYQDDPAADRYAEEWMKTHEDDVMAPMMKLASAGQKCATNARFMEVMDRLGQMGE